ncbi:hypothetical protein [Providencia manganoxydans]|uniref:Uncharacterized protein n=1 Tax=Providencia stuartii TaxID=588 RepID=A0A1S1HT82_PROST|nr:hypothetical protein A3Q29_22155 [Providencia stuartii]OHT25576.1 hypothetical protein A3Q29_22110 [Providencia stuartii]
MPSTTDFDTWLDDVDSDHEEVIALYEAVLDVSDRGLYKCVKGNKYDTWVVSSNHHSENLFLASETARDTFLALIKKRLCGGEDVESWYGFQRNMSNEHS